MMDCRFNGVIGFKKKQYKTESSAAEGSVNSQTVAGRLKSVKDRLEVIGVHETGHLLELALIRKNLEYKDDGQRETA
jgi:hypothetical protein